MEKEKLILSQNGDKFYLSIPENIKIGRYENSEVGFITDIKYYYFIRDKNFTFTGYKNKVGLYNDFKDIFLFYVKDNVIILPQGSFELKKEVFDKLRKLLKNYNDIFDIELKEFYNDGNFKTDKIKIEYEMIKLENPIKNKSYLFRLKDNNIPKGWIEQSEYLIKRLENLNARYGNISQNKVNLIDFNGYIPKNIDFVISEIYAKRVDELFKSWNNNNKKSNKMELVEFLYREYNQINLYGDNYFIILNDKITVLVNVEELKILEFKTMYHNIDMVSYNKLVDCVNNIQKEIDRINEKRVDN